MGAVVFFVCFAMLFAMVPIWFSLITNLFRILRARHPEKYSAMGNPTLIMNNSLANNIATLRFIWRREDKALGDVGLSKLTGFMKVFLMVYTVIFLIVVILMPLAER